MHIGLLHPGQMGVSIGAALVESGHQMHWCAEGRGAETTQRAAAFNPQSTLVDLCANVQAIVSVCPPDAAQDLAKSVADTGFTGLYLDANAVAPQTAQRTAQIIGDNYVDGGIIGPPALRAGSTRLYLSGALAEQVAGWFSASFVEAIIVDQQVSSASALKMAYAAYTKGSSALLLAVNALARQAGVEEALHQEWQRSQPKLQAQSERAASGTAPKAWRFVGEMQEIAQTFSALDLPDGFHQAAGQIYQRMSELKNQPDVGLPAVIDEITKSSD